ncbi:MAG: GNAT family N-acetyltransferase [Hyphomicrobiaceae bacterium]|nr:GNAT family N-acetyltransferase [Hyphomicrobiaceae bacterium]
MSDLIDYPSRSRFEMEIEGHIAFVAYRRGDGVIYLDHAEVPRALEGRGHGSTLVRATLDAVRAEGLKVVPRCGFVGAYIRRHPDYADLLA